MIRPPAGTTNSEMIPLGVIRPTEAAARSVNQILPSGPAVMRKGPFGPVSANSVIPPATVILPIRSPPPDVPPFSSKSPSNSVNQRLRYGPSAMNFGDPPLGTAYSAITPDGVILPILLDCSVNHTVPSGPAQMPTGWLSWAGRENSVITPAVVIRPILSLYSSVNHRFPSEPAVIPVTTLPALPPEGNNRWHSAVCRRSRDRVLG